MSVFVFFFWTFVDTSSSFTDWTWNFRLFIKAIFISLFFLFVDMKSFNIIQNYIQRFIIL